MRLFGKYGDGASEIVDSVGLIANDLDFTKWVSVLPLGLRDLAGIVGFDTVEGIVKLYEGHDGPSAIVRYAQQSVACFTWVKIIPTLDAGHGATGRSARLGENEKGLTALQEFKDEENILHLAYEATDALIAQMEREEFKPWINSRKYRQRDGLLLRTKEEFDDYYNIGSHRLFVTLLPIIREVQSVEIAPILGSDRLHAMLDGSLSVPEVREVAARALALLTMQKAVERLPVEVIPSGIVQVQQSLPVNQRLRAERESRQSVSASLGDDARRYLDRLQSLIGKLETGEDDGYICGPITHSRGMTF